jgi:ribosome-associated protein
LKRRPSFEGRSNEDKPSRTQKKKRAESLQAIGTRLLSLTAEQLQELQLPSELVDAVLDAHKMNSHGARRRQLQYIGSLMRQIDAAALEQDLDRLTWQSRREVRSFKLAEQWRDELIKGDRERRAWLTEKFPAIDQDMLQRLSENAAHSPADAERRRAGRALFRYLRQFTDENE